jgi:hypothetical protein
MVAFLLTAVLFTVKGHITHTEDMSLTELMARLRMSLRANIDETFLTAQNRAGREGNES